MKLPEEAALYEAWTIQNEYHVCVGYVSNTDTYMIHIDTYIIH